MRRYEHGGNIYGGEKIKLDFSVNTNPLGLPECVKTALRSDESIYTRYPDTQYRALRAALEQHHGVREGQVLCGNGAADMIFRLCAWKKAKRILLPAPTFSEYERSVRLFGGEIREHKLSPDNGFLVTKEFAEHISEDTDMVFLCNPNNPTGQLVPEDVMDHILERCRELGVLLMVDECFIEFTDGRSLAKKLDEYPNLLILRAFTKLYAMAGIRLGYMLGNESILEQMSVYGAEWSVSGPAQAAGLAALTAEPEWTQMSRSLAARERSFMAEELEKMGIAVFPSYANFMLLRSDLPLHEELKKRGIYTRSCGNFSGLDESYIRIALRNRADNEILLNAVRGIIYG